MIENLIRWLNSNASIIISIALIIIPLVLGYYFVNWNAKKNKLLERRTEIFESILRSLSNLLDRTMIFKSAKESYMEIKKLSIGMLFKEEHEKMDLETMKDEFKEQLQKIGADTVEDKEVDELLRKSLLSFFETLGMYLQSSITEVQLELNENVMASKMYLDPKMRNELKIKADELNEYFEKFHSNEIDNIQLYDKASEFAEKIYELMKFRFTLIPSIKSKKIV